MPGASQAPKDWPGGAAQREADRARRAAPPRRAPRDRVREQPAHRAVAVRDRELGLLGTRLDRLARHLDQLPVERVARPAAAPPCAAAARRPRRVQDRREVDAARRHARPPRRRRAGRRGRRDRRSARSPSCAMILRASSATKKKKLTTCSGLPANFCRSSGSCVAIPTGHVLRWQARIITQPSRSAARSRSPSRRRRAAPR